MLMLTDNNTDAIQMIAVTGLWLFRIILDVCLPRSVHNKHGSSMLRASSNMFYRGLPTHDSRGRYRSGKEGYLGFTPPTTKNP